MNTCNANRRKAVLLQASATAAVIAAVLLVCFSLTLAGWGYNQAVTLDLVEDRLKKGMTVAQAEGALAFPPGEIANRLTPLAGAVRYAAISDSGAVGSLFVPQHHIILLFNKKGMLTDCIAQMHWRTDEKRIPCNIGS